MASTRIVQLRPYQQQAVNDLRMAYRSGARAPLLVLSTGAGKTVIFAAITQTAAARGRRVLILVHRRELIHQASAKLTQAGVTHGIIAAGFEPSDHPVQVASVQTLARRLHRIVAQPDLIVIDEAHHATANTWGKALSHWPDALRLGVTATPVRQDGRGLGMVFDQLVLGPSTAELMAAGYLTPARIYAPPPVADLTGIHRRAGDYAIDEAAERMDRPTVTGDAISHYQRIGAGQPAIVFCCNVKHAEHVCHAFNNSGVQAATLLGCTDPVRRDATVAGFAAGTLQVLVTVDVVSEGFDIPAAGCAILLRPTQSLGLYLQQVGRVLRPAPGKTAAIVLDHVGNVHRHGFPDDHRDWTLADRERRGGSTGQPAPSVRTCEVCFAAFKPAPMCPCCGAACAPPPRLIRQQDGELKELQREAVQQRVAERKKAQSIEQLIAVGQARGMKNPAGWARHVFYARQHRSGAVQ
jgi:superfamily II DNA or RNA helicase